VYARAICSSFLSAIYLFFYLARRASSPNDYIVSEVDCT